MVKLTEKLISGVNLGGWISQYDSVGVSGDALGAHFENYITEDDLRLIASWGMDHVRVPVDYPVLMDIDEATGAVTFREDGFSHVRRCMEWCKKLGLKMVLDLHKAPGFSFFDASNSLFSSPICRAQLIALWDEISRRFCGEGDWLFYELINEVKDVEAEKWNELAQELIAAIRKNDTEHYIIVGSIDMNNIEGLPKIERFADDRIIYNFHMYIPIIMTHQKADFMPFGVLMRSEIPYPCPKEVYNGEIQRMMEIMARARGGEYTPQTGNAFVERDIDLEYMRGVFSTAKRFIEERGLPVYCGEYGMIEHASHATVANYLHDIGVCCHELGIGRAVWNYKGLGFALVDADRNIINEAAVKAAAADFTR